MLCFYTIFDILQYKATVPALKIIFYRSQFPSSAECKILASGYLDSLSFAKNDELKDVLIFQFLFICLTMHYETILKR